MAESCYRLEAAGGHTCVLSAAHEGDHRASYAENEEIRWTDEGHYGFWRTWDAGTNWAPINVLELPNYLTASTVQAGEGGIGTGEVEPGRGGDCRIITGQGGLRPDGTRVRGGDFFLQTGEGVEWLRINYDEEVFIKGRSIGKIDELLEKASKLLTIATMDDEFVKEWKALAGLGKIEPITPSK